MDIYAYLESRLSTFEKGHSIVHALKVASNGYHALRDFPTLTNYEKDAVILACLLHDLNDHKFVHFENYIPVKELLPIFYSDLHPSVPDLVQEMIDLVSCSVNGDSIVFPTWKVIPRYADRIEAMGKIGLKRAISYASSIQRPFTISTTLPARSLNELMVVANKDRWELYIRGHKTDTSTMDHLYDKVVHLQIPYWFTCPYLSQIAKKRQEWLYIYIIRYWNSISSSSLDTNPDQNIDKTKI